MIPRTLSASSLNVAETCMARWKAENFERVPSMDNAPALTGTSVHGGLESFVKSVYIDKKADWSDKQLLLDMYQLAYVETFNTANLETDEYADGLELTNKWYDRTTIKGTVISCETKSNFPIKTSVGDIPFTYIWDRCDQLDATTIKVVDYKTIRAYLSSEDLKRKIQPRAYALAAQIQFPQAERIWVEFDLLRHDSVGAVFTKEDNAAMYRYLQRAAERIIATDEENTPETLNPECHFCVRKVVCKTLGRAAAGGTVFGISAEEAALRKLEIDSQIKALGYLSAELDTVLMAEAQLRDEIEWVTPSAKVAITARKTRKINPTAVANIIGYDIAKKYNGFTMGNVDKLLKGHELTDEQKNELRAEIYFTWGEPSAKVTPLDTIDEE